MQVKKIENEHGLNIFVGDKNKYISFCFAGNLDLYWSIHRRSFQKKDMNYNHDTFTITKENSYLYNLFIDLFDDIKNINIYSEEIEVPYYINTIEDRNDYIEEELREREERKNRYKKYNSSLYNDLYDEKNEIITWYSDETNIKTANYVKIAKKENEFVLEFNTQPDIIGYDSDFKTNYNIPVRFRNSGSRYDPFNIIFMKMYNKMDQLDDILDEGHQITVEEYLYNQDRSLVKK